MNNLIKTILATVILIIDLNIYAQAPQKFSYQAVIRNSTTQLVSNQQVVARISILQINELGNVVFSEMHTPTTNNNGLATIQVGSGTNISGNINNINWSNGPYFIKSEIDPNGGNNYTLTTTTQLLSVPYALYAENSGSSIPGPQGEQGPIGLTGPQGEQGPPSSDNQQLSVSVYGDTLYLQNGGYVIIPGISLANQPQNTCNNDNIFNTNTIYNTITDIDGNNYKTIVIGNQTWMAENLKVTRYQNGDEIPNVQDSIAWLNVNMGAYCTFSSDTVLSCSYGNIYNWYTTTDPRNVCPTGWRVPSEEDFNELKLFLDPLASGPLGNNNLAGGYLKSTSNNWASPNVGATNSTGFSAIPTVARAVYGLPAAIFVNDNGYQSQLWSTFSLFVGEGDSYNLSTFGTSLSRGSTSKNSGLSIRCVIE